MRRPLLSALLLCAPLFAGPAQAAFRYSGNGGQGGYQPGGQPPLTVEMPQAAPAAATDEFPTTYIGGNAPAPAPDAAPAAVEVASPEAAAPMPEAAAPMMEAPAPSMAPMPPVAAPVAGSLATQADAGEIREGFGADVPLVVALQGILPQGYGFAYGAGVPIAQPVTWAGAKPWRILLSDVLAGISLYAVESERFVYIEKK